MPTALMGCMEQTKRKRRANPGRSLLAFYAYMAIIMAGCRPQPPPHSWAGDQVTNYRRLEDGLATANAVTPDAIPQLRAAGFNTIVDLRTRSEHGLVEEAAAAARAGIRYINVPVSPATLSAQQVRAVAEVLDQPANRPIFLHCSSGNRVGAIMELYREKIHGVPHESARRESRLIGLQLPEVIEAVERVERQMDSAE